MSNTYMLAADNKWTVSRVVHTINKPSAPMQVYRQKAATVWVMTTIDRNIPVSHLDHLWATLMHTSQAPLGSGTHATYAHTAANDVKSHAQEQH